MNVSALTRFDAYLFTQIKMRKFILFVFGGILIVGALATFGDYFNAGFQYVREISTFYSLPSEFWYSIGFVIGVALVARAYSLITD